MCLNVSDGVCKQDGFKAKRDADAPEVKERAATPTSPSSDCRPGMPCMPPKVKERADTDAIREDAMIVSPRNAEQDRQDSLPAHQTPPVPSTILPEPTPSIALGPQNVTDIGCFIACEAIYANCIKVRFLSQSFVASTLLKLTTFRITRAATCTRTSAKSRRAALRTAALRPTTTITTRAAGRTVRVSDSYQCVEFENDQLPGQMGLAS